MSSEEEPGVASEGTDVPGVREEVLTSDDPAVPDDAVTSEGAWNPEGLDLARSVAASLGAGGPGAPTHRPGQARPRDGFDGFSGSSSRRRRRPEQSSGAWPDDRDPQALDAAIGRLVFERGWTTDVAVAGAIARWDQIVGPEVATHCRAERYSRAELTVRADSTAWATQVRMLAPALVRRLNEELGDGTVEKVTVLGPSAPSWRKGPRTVRDGRGPRDTYG